MSLMRQMFLADGGTPHFCPVDKIQYLVVGSRCGRCGGAIYPSTPLNQSNFYSRHDPGSYTLPTGNINTFRG